MKKIQKSQRHIPVIGIIGGIGAGKSTVAHEFAKLGCAVIDADALAHEALENPVVIEAVTKQWSRTVLKAGGQIDRNQLGKIVFSNPDELKILNHIIHPHVLRESEKRLLRHQSDPRIPAIILDMPLLLEVGWDQHCDHIIFVKCDRSQRKINFCKKLDPKTADLDKREKNQISLDIKEGRADNVLINNSDFETLVKQVIVIFSNISN